jgi:hypothetical protein
MHAILHTHLNLHLISQLCLVVTINYEARYDAVPSEPFSATLLGQNIPKYKVNTFLRALDQV